jgi:hypothetical protein
MTAVYLYNATQKNINGSYTKPMRDETYFLFLGKLSAN